MKHNRSLGVAIAAIVLVFGGIYLFGPGAANPTVLPTPTATSSALATVSYRGVEGKSALELLKANHRVETKKYDFGELVEAIDGQKSDSSKYWIVYADGKMSEVGADALITKNGQLVEWRLEPAK